ncbi:MAG: hypothetical protein IAG13_22890, partial [Deltaproteobacteria bacterium]|nr:hypothetical protein [Nannocystaceae bacterium]
RIDGILGTNVLHHGVLELDYPGGHVRLASSPERLPARGAGQPLALIGAWMPQLAIDSGGRTIGSLLLDSGSMGALSLPSSLRASLGVTDVASGRGTIGVGAHGPVYGSKQAFAWPAATIGGRSFVGVETVAHDTDTGTLGARVLRAYVVRIDYREHTAALWPSGAALPHAAHSFGFEWTAGPTPRVSFVWEGSAAAKAGIAPGQPITAIDGRALATMTAQARCELARDMSALASPSSRSFRVEGRFGARTIVLQRVPL